MNPIAKLATKPKDMKNIPFKNAAAYLPDISSPASVDEQIAVIGPAILALLAPTSPEKIPPNPLIMVMAFIGTLYPCPLITPMAWAFSAPTKGGKWN